VQVWKELLHSGNQTVEADIQLASLLIRNNLQDDARIALNRAGGKVKTAERRYQIGVLLVQLNDLESAVKHFERIVTMRDARESKAKASNPISGSPALPSQSLSFPDTSVFDLPKDIVRRSN
ncbi:MAG: hypothetical protein OXI86_07295, partial [Candidatus Poribacteria bacterium]|nr:hypothetical protein [Candidatus Poribacteria bacterium]